MLCPVHLRADNAAVGDRLAPEIQHVRTGGMIYGVWGWFGAQLGCFLGQVELERASDVTFWEENDFESFRNVLVIV